MSWTYKRAISPVRSGGATYKKRIYPPTWSYTPPTYTVTVDTSSPWITNTISPITVVDGSTATYYSSLYTRVVLTDPATNVDVTLADEFTTLSWWSMDVGWTTSSMTSWISYPITDNTELVPTVSHLVIHKDTQWPCPNGYHIGTRTEWSSIVSMLDRLWVKNETDTMNYLKLPAAYYLNRSNWSKNQSYWKVRIWTSTMTNNATAPAFIIDENHVVQVKDDKPGNAFSIRPLKDNPMIPDSTWTTLYQWAWNAWIFWNSTLWLISLSRDWITWATMADKNLWATNVWDDGLYYQFWNNHGFAVSPSTYYTSKVSNTQWYWPGNYYDDEHFIRVSSWNNWFTDTNNNIWWWVTNGTWTMPYYAFYNCDWTFIDDWYVSPGGTPIVPPITPWPYEVIWIEPAVWPIYTDTIYRVICAA